MTFRIAALLALLPLTLALAACKPDAAPAESPAAPVESGSVAGTDATAVIDPATSDPAGFDRNAFAGTFSGTVPCADCPGIDTRLAINADGTFTLDESYQDRDTRNATTGTWTLDADGKRLQLDPDGQDAENRWFEIVSGDEVRMLDTEGNPITSEHNYSLRRG